MCIYKQIVSEMMLASGYFPAQNGIAIIHNHML